MKKLTILLLSVAAFAACDKEQDMYRVLPIEQATSPALVAHSAIEITADNLADITTFKWSPADFGITAAIEYSLYAVVEDTSKRQLVGSAFGDSLEVKKENLNKAVLNAGGGKNETVTVTFTLVASISTAYGTVASAPITVEVATTAPLFPDHLYMTGADFGSWGWGDGTVEMIPVHSHEGHFWCVRYFTAANGFKWCAVKEWNGDFFSLGTDAGFTTNEGNAFVAADGLYSVYVDYLSSTITIEPAQVYGMGDCFGGWTTGQYPFTPDGTAAKITATAGGELRMYATSSATSADWWQMEFIIIDGKIEYRGAGDDQQRVNVDAGKVVTLDFNAGTGTIE
jgi:hypothetical protein